MSQIRWLVLNYNLPTVPSKHRVAVWRALKKIGAVNIQQSMWVLPNNDENYTVMKHISKDIKKRHGDAFLMDSIFFEVEHETQAINLFNEVRNEEYNQILMACEKYLVEIEKKINKAKLNFKEFSDNEHALEKLKKWYQETVDKDIFNASLREKTKKQLEEISKIFNDYCELTNQQTGN